jgi:hypothetical protein
MPKEKKRHLAAVSCLCVLRQHVIVMSCLLHPKGLPRPWEDPMPEEAKRHLAAVLCAARCPQPPRQPMNPTTCLPSIDAHIHGWLIMHAPALNPASCRSCVVWA